MPTAPVNDRGDVLAYEDSGPPSDHTDYTTIVIVHGLVFYTPVFHRLLPYARERNFRIVLLNMRDYPGSSSFSPEELKAFSTSPHNAVQEIGHQFAAFLVYFVQKYKIPEIRLIDGKQTAGLVFLTWSFSNTFHMSVLGNAHTLPAETKAVLSKYWRRSVMYDPALGNIGATIPPGAYSPLRDASLTPTALTKKFATWVSNYYPPISASAMETYTVEDLIARQQLAGDPSFKEGLPVEYMKTSTVERMTTEELERMTDPGVVERSAQAMRAVPRDIYKDNARRALWEPEVDPDSGSGEITFPNLSVLVLWFDMTMGDCIWAVKTLHDAYAAEQQKEGSRAREVEFVCLKWLNHFAHWDDPEGIMRNLAEHL